MLSVFNKMKMFIRENLKYNLLLNIILLILLQLVVLYLSFNTFFEDFYLRKLEDKARSIALILSKNDFIISAVENRRFDINNYVEDLRNSIGCQYIVVADKNGIRFSHPNPSNIGKKFVGDDYQKTIEKGEVYTSQAIGTLGPSLRSFAPLISHGKIIGFVSVGYLISHIKQDLNIYKNILIVYLFFIGLLGLIFSSYITKKIKKLTFGLEPLEIAKLYNENRAILDSIKEGIISIDNRFNLKYLNKSAKILLENNKLEPNYILKMILDRLAMSKDNYGILDEEEIKVSDKILVVSSNPIILDESINGYLLFFYEKDEIERLKDEIKSMKRCSDVLRAQSHEYSNKLHMLSGLLQLEAFEEAKKFLLKESEDFHSTIEYIENRIKDNYIKGIFIGKFSVANELGCKIFFNKDSNGWSYDFKEISDISTVIANIIQNAIEASLVNDSPKVFITLDEDEKDLYLTVEDNGQGVRNKKDIFDCNFSTKGKNRGFGLYNVKIILNKIGGKIDVDNSERLKGAKFSIIIPKGKV